MEFAFDYVDVRVVGDDELVALRIILSMPALRSAYSLAT
jgi:hypothetical protein